MRCRFGWSNGFKSVSEFGVNKVTRLMRGLVGTPSPGDCVISDIKIAKDGVLVGRLQRRLVVVAWCNKVGHKN